jgi:hypothetical protein
LELLLEQSDDSLGRLFYGSFSLQPLRQLAFHLGVTVEVLKHDRPSTPSKHVIVGTLDLLAAFLANETDGVDVLEAIFAIVLVDFEKLGERWRPLVSRG